MAKCIETVLRHKVGLEKQGAEILVELLHLGYSPESVAKMVAAIRQDSGKAHQ